MTAKLDWRKRLQKRGPAPAQESNVIDQLREVRQQLHGIESYFALESDEDLIEAAIYLREALEARQRHLLKLAREQNAVAAAPPVTQDSRERWLN